MTEASRTPCFAKSRGPRRILFQAAAAFSSVAARAPRPRARAQLPVSRQTVLTLDRILPGGYAQFLSAPDSKRAPTARTWKAWWARNQAVFSTNGASE